MCIVESGIMEFGLYQGWLLGITLGIIYWVGLNRLDLPTIQKEKTRW
jgi:hypothetical protein